MAGRDNRTPPKGYPMSGAVEDTRDPDEVTDRYTALAEHPHLQRAFQRLETRSELMRAELGRATADIAKSLTDQHEINEAQRKRMHELTGAIAVVNAHQESHDQLDDQRIETMERGMADRDKAVGKLEEAIERKSTSSTRWLIVFLGLAVSIAGTIIAAWIVMSERVQRVEDRLEAAKEAAKLHDDQVDHALDKLDGKVDAIAVRLGVTAPPTP